jgi:hypothetical protein
MKTLATINDVAVVDTDKHTVVRFAMQCDEGKTWTADLYLTGTSEEKAAQNQERTIKTLREIGWSENDLGDFTSIKSARVCLTIEPETYNGNTRDKVKWINHPDAINFGMGSQSTKTSELNARLKGLMLKHKPGNAVHQVDGGVNF